MKRFWLVVWLGIGGLMVAGLAGVTVGQTPSARPPRLEAVLPDLRDARDPKMLELYASAVAAYYDRRNDDMVAAARAVAARDGRTANEKAFGHLLVGIALFTKKELGAADAEFARVLETVVAPRDRAAYRGTALLLSGVVRLAKDDYSGSAQRLAALLQEHPGLAVTVYALRPTMQALSKSGRAAEVPDLLESVVQKAPGTEQARGALWHLGCEYEREDKLDLARGAFTKIVQEYPDTPTAKAAQERLASLGESNGAGCCGSGHDH